MFNFTKTTIINSAKGFDGKPMFYVGKGLDDEAFYVRRFGGFEKGCIKSVSHAKPEDPEYSTLEISIPGDLKKGSYRISVQTKYVGAYPSDQMHSTFLNPGSIYSYDFEVLEDNENQRDIAKRLKTIVEKYKTLYNDNQHFKVEVDGNKISFTATSPFMTFGKAVMEYFEGGCNICDNSFFEVIKEYTERDSEGKYISVDGSKVTDGHPGFGDTAYMISHVMTPSYENTIPWGVNADIRPAAGVKYHQYVISYYRNRGPLGMNSVGDEVNSLTQHIIWVAESVNDEFNGALAGFVGDKLTDAPKTPKNANPNLPEGEGGGAAPTPDEDEEGD